MMTSEHGFSLKSGSQKYLVHQTLICLYKTSRPWGGPVFNRPGVAGAVFGQSGEA